MIVSPDGSQFFVASPFFSSGAQTDILALQDGRVLNLFIGFSLDQNDQGAFLIDGVVFDPETGVSEPAFSIERGEQVFSDRPQAVELADGRIAVIWGDPQNNQISAPNNLTLQVFSSDFTSASPPRTIIEGALNPNGSGGNYDIIALPDGGFAVAWLPFLGLDLLPQDRIQTTMLTLFDAGGNNIGNDIAINPEAPSSDSAPQVIALADGTLVVGWFSAALDIVNLDFGSSRFQLVSAAGELVGDQILLPDTTPDNDVVGLLSPARITALANGGFAAVWVEITDQGDVKTTRIFAQLYDANGVEVSGVVTVDTQLEASGAQFAITALKFGGFVVAYTETNGSGPDVSGTAIQTAVVASDGEVLERDVLVNEVTLGNQDSPFVVETDDGGFSVVWHDDEQFGDGRDIFGRTFDVPADGGPIATDDDDVPANETPDDGGTAVATASDDILVGTVGDDIIRGLGGDDTINAGQGNDIVRGSRGDDQVRGNGGDDTLIGNGGADNVRGGGGDDLVNGNGGADVLRGNGGADIINGGGGADIIRGGGGADTINGGGGADDIFGNGGADILTGRGGNDTLTGNGGADIFQFRTSDRADVIRDFRQGQDIIEIISGANSFAQLLIEQDGRDVLISFGAGQVRVITDDAGAFGEDDFIF